jgi:two-component system OmpR family sensor kinase
VHEQLTDWWNGVSLRTKITGVTVLLVTLGLLVAGAGTMTVLRNYLSNVVDQRITQSAESVTGVSGTDTSCDPMVDPDRFYFAVLNTSGEIICGNERGNSSPQLDNLDLPTVQKLDSSTFTVWDTSHNAEWRVVALPVTDTNSGAILTVVVGENLNDNNGIINQFLVIFLGFGLSVIILGAALTRILVTSTFSPLKEVEITAAAIADGDFSQRLPGSTPNTEVGRLNRSLNTMLGRIDRAFADRARTIDQMRRFVGDASHELRTPLVSVRGYAELYRMGALQKPEDIGQAMERIEKEAIRMGELVQDLLELARIDEAKPLNLGPVDLQPIAQDAALDAMASAPDRKVTVFLSASANDDDADADDAFEDTAAMALPPSTATGPIAFAGAQLARLRSRRARTSVGSTVVRVERSGDRTAGDTILTGPAIVLAEENKIRQVVTNLMGNALRFTPEGSPIELGVQVDTRRGIATLDIVDHGEGIPPQIREKIFQRFWRADSSRTRETGGSGLGLSIVAAIMAAHRGEVTVLETPGGGATFRLSLPLMPHNNPLLPHNK